MSEKRMTTFRMKSYLHTKKGAKIVDIFGHTSRGLPGLEIKGIGGLSSVMKEKLIYFTRLHQYKVPMKRFVLCTEIDSSEVERGELSYLELPLLILFWAMADILKITRLDNCLASGKINVDGEIILQSVKNNNDYTLITGKNCEYQKKINIEELFGDSSSLFVKSKELLQVQNNLGDNLFSSRYISQVAQAPHRRLNNMSQTEKIVAIQVAP
jgi:hypothetical protein